MYYFELLKTDDISARALAMSMLSTAGVETITIKRLLRAGALFGIEAAAMRVAVTRLVKDELLTSPERGVYQTSDRSKALTAKLQGWQTILQKTSAWSGDWLVVLTHALGRTDRKLLRAQARILALHGYADTNTGLWVRPANLSAAADQHYKDMVNIGLDERAPLFHVTEKVGGSDMDWPALWSVADLKRSYEAALTEMENSLARLEKMPTPEAARETLLVGQSVIRIINFDPLLPPEIGESALFAELVAGMLHYNKVGLNCWDKYNAATA